MGNRLAGRYWHEEREEVEGARRAMTLAAKDGYGTWIEQLRPWTAFVTLTFDPKGWLPSATGIGPAISDRSAARRFRYYADHVGEAAGRHAVGVVALDHHKSGEPHGHGLVYIDGEPREGQLHLLAGLWESKDGNGWARHEVPRSLDQVARYCAKYMVKDLGELVFSEGFR